MNNAPHISQDDLAILALGFLPDDEALIAAEHLEGCAECRDALSRLQGDVALYALTAEMHTPPAKARERLLRRVAKEPKFVALERPVAVTVSEVSDPAAASRSDLLTTYRERPVSRPAVGWAGWMGWAAALVMTAGLGWEYSQAKLAKAGEDAARNDIRAADDKYARAQELLEALRDPQAMQVALHVQGGSPAPEGHAVYNPGSGRLVFLATHLQAIPAAKTYQLWLLPVSGQAPVPAGLFKPDASGNATVIMPELPKSLVAKGFGVTIEPDGGSKAPTPPIVLAGM